MVYLRYFPYSVLFLTLFTLGGCGGSDSSDDNTADQQKIAAARTAAVTSISENLNTSLDSVDAVVSNSAATDVLVDTGTGVTVNANAFVDQNVSAQTQTIFNALAASTRKQVNNGISAMSSHTATDTLGVDVEQMLTDIMGAGSVNGDTITYSPNLNVICAIPDGDPNFNADACREFYSHITVEQQIISDTDGTLTFKFDAHAPFVIGYASNSIYFEVVLAELNNAFAAAAILLVDLGSPALLDTPTSMYDSFEGTIRLTITKLGEQAGSIGLSIPQAISISGTIDGNAQSLTIAATDNVIEVSADAVANTASIAFGLGAVTALSTVENINAPNELLPMSLNLSAFEGVFTFSSANSVDTLVGSDISLGVSPLSYSIDNMEALNVSMDALSFTVNSADQTVVLDTGLDFSLSVANVNAAFADFFSADIDPTDQSLQASLAVTAPMATVFTNRGLPANDPLAVDEIFELTQGGPLDVTGVDYLQGSLSVSTGECFTGAGSGAFPIEAATCPATVQ
ncbi:MAG: hypothetical protein LJE85_05370 [Gammaproteobacteria bacterium]|nr:hypothetical protein [Gammaproteobacteria bacterium]